MQTFHWVLPSCLPIRADSRCGGQTIHPFHRAVNTEQNLVIAQSPRHAADIKDYFSIYSRSAGAIAVDLTSHTGSGVQLHLYYQSVENRVAYDLSLPYHIEYTGPAGWYYIYIYTESNHNSTPYTLRVTYP